MLRESHMYLHALMYHFREGCAEPSLYLRYSAYKWEDYNLVGELVFCVLFPRQPTWANINRTYLFEAENKTAFLN